MNQIKISLNFSKDNEYLKLDFLLKLSFFEKDKQNKIFYDNMSNEDVKLKVKEAHWINETNNDCFGFAKTVELRMFTVSSFKKWNIHDLLDHPSSYETTINTQVERLSQFDEKNETE